MSRKSATTLTPESLTAMLASVGVALDPARAESAAATLNAQVAGVTRAAAEISFETEPATYLKVASGEAA
jgi:hypothetical protein